MFTMDDRLMALVEAEREDAARQAATRAAIRTLDSVHDELSAIAGACGINRSWAEGYEAALEAALELVEKLGGRPRYARSAGNRPC